MLALPGHLVVYPELARLEELGLVKGEPGSTNGRRRKAYELTPAGKQALREWLTSEEPLHVEFRHEGALKLFFSDSLSAAEQREQLRRVRERHERVGNQLRQILPAAREGAAETGLRFPYLTLDFGIAFQEFVADWCKRTERELARQPAKRR